MLFHVMEMYLSYVRCWNGNNHNPDIYPTFAPFVMAAKLYDENILQSDFQVIFATSSIAWELNTPEYTVGKYYTRENKSLKMLVNYLKA